MNLIRKHGLVPKSAYPESKSSSNTRWMNSTLKDILSVRCWSNRVHKNWGQLNYFLLRKEYCDPRLAKAVKVGEHKSNAQYGDFPLVVQFENRFGVHFFFGHFLAYFSTILEIVLGQNQHLPSTGP